MWKHIAVHKRTYIRVASYIEYNGTTEALIFKVTPHTQGIYNKSLVNIFSLLAEDFEKQAIFLKKLKYAYNAKMLVIDANGLIFF